MTNTISCITVGGWVVSSFPPPKGTRGCKRRFDLTAAERAEELRDERFLQIKLRASAYMTSPIIIIVEDTYNDI